MSRVLSVLRVRQFDGTESRLSAFRPPCPVELIEIALPRVLANIVSGYVGADGILVRIEEFAKSVHISRIYAKIIIHGSERLEELALAGIGAAMNICVQPALKSLILYETCVKIDWGEGALPAGLTHIYGRNVHRFPWPMENMPNVESIAVSNISRWGHVQILGVAPSLRTLDCKNIACLVEVFSDDMPWLASLYLTEVNVSLALSHTFGVCKLEAIRVYNASGEWDFGGIPETITSISLVNVVDSVDFSKIKCPENAVFMEVRGSPPKFSWSY